MFTLVDQIDKRIRRGRWWSDGKNIYTVGVTGTRELLLCNFLGELLDIKGEQWTLCFWMFTMPHQANTGGRKSFRSRYGASRAVRGHVLLVATNIEIHRKHLLSSECVPHIRSPMLHASRCILYLRPPTNLSTFLVCQLRFFYYVILGHELCYKWRKGAKKHS